MKKKCFFAILVCTCFSIQLIAQRAGKKAYQKKQSQITVGYGIGNVWKHFLDKEIQIDNYFIKSTGPLALTYDYAFFKRFSAGLTGSYYILKGKYEKTNFSFTDKLTILTLLARINYHYCTTGKLDPYIGAGIGINNSKYRNSESFNANNSEPSNFDYSGQAGLRYFPTSHLGLFVEVGYVAGSFVMVGLTGKF